MNIQKNASPEDLESSILHLRNTARNAIEVSDWFKQNLALLGLIASDNIFDNTVTVHHNPLDVLNDDVGENPSVKMTLKAAVKDTTKPSELVSRMFHYDGSSTSRHTLEYNFDFSFNDWPYLTANLARTVLYAQPGSMPSATRLRGHALLETYIPKHFPGLSWATLQTLATLDLLPSKPGTFPDDPFIDMLFAYRTEAGGMSFPEVVLPDVLEP